MTLFSRALSAFPVDLPDDCLSVLRDSLQSCDPFTKHNLDDVMRGVAKQLDTSYSKLMKLTRMILTGTEASSEDYEIPKLHCVFPLQKSPGLPAIMELLGRDSVLRRIDRFKGD